MDTITANKIFYYDDESENLLEEADAEETSLEEVTDEVFNLDDDDVSYVGIIASGIKYKIKSDDYDSYKIYQFDEPGNEYILAEMGDWEKCKLFLTKLFHINLI